MLKRSLLTALLLTLWVCAASAQQFVGTTVVKSLENDTTTGTQLNYLAKVVTGTSGRAKLVKAAVTDTAIDLYVVNLNAGTSGSATYVFSGDVPCVFDSTTTGMAGKYVVASVTTAGQCHVQTAAPGSGMVVGKLNEDTTTAGQVSNIMAMNQSYNPGTSGTGTVTSVGITVPVEFTVSPATTQTVTGVFTIAKAAVAQNCVLAGPSSGGANVWACRALTIQDMPTGVASGNCGGDLGSTFPNCSVLKASTTFALPGETSPTLSGDVNDYAGCTTAICNINGGVADRRITGFTAPATGGSLLEVCNAGTTNTLTLVSLTSSSAANQLSLTEDVTLTPRACQLLRYSVQAAKWQALSLGQGESERTVPIKVIVGDPGAASPALANDNDTPEAWGNEYGRPVVLQQFACQALQTSGTLTIDIVHAGTTTSVLSGPCTCGNGGTTRTWANCTLTATAANLTINSFSGNGTVCTTAPCGLDVNVTDVGTGGAKYVAVKGKGVRR